MFKAYLKILALTVVGGIGMVIITAILASLWMRAAGVPL